MPSASLAHIKGGTRKDHTFLLLSPDLLRISPPSSHDGKLPAKFTYRYRYKGGSPTQSWVGNRRYVAVDLSAGPCEVTPTTPPHACLRH